MIEYIMINILRKWKIVETSKLKLLFKRSWLNSYFNTYHLYDNPTVYTYQVTHKNLEEVEKYLIWKWKTKKCKHKNAYHFHDNAPPYCTDCDSYIEHL